MSNGNRNSSDNRRMQESIVGHEVAEMVLQVMKGSFAKTQSWHYSQDAAYRFQKAAKIIAEEIDAREVRYCFDEAAEQLTPDIHKDDLWARAASAGAQYYLQLVSAHGHAYGHRDRARGDFISAVEDAMAGRHPE